MMTVQEIERLRSKLIRDLEAVLGLTHEVGEETASHRTGEQTNARQDPEHDLKRSDTEN